MNLVGIIGVKDEAELIGVAARHMRRIGADVVVVLDVGSQDGSREVVERLGAEDPQIRLADVRGGLWRGLAAYEAALDGFEPDWVVPADADEFWIPRTPSLKQLPGLAESDVLIANRFNVPLTSPPTEVVACVAAGRSEELPLIVKRERLSSDIMRADPSKRWIMNSIVEKVMCRVSLIASLTPGAHKVLPVDGEDVRRRKTADVLIAHVPFTSFGRFEQKVENARHELERSGDIMTGDRGWHWRRWVEFADRGMLREEFEAQRIGGAELEASYAAGTIRTAREVLREQSVASGKTDGVQAE